MSVIFKKKKFIKVAKKKKKEENVRIKTEKYTKSNFLVFQFLQPASALLGGIKVCILVSPSIQVTQSRTEVAKVSPSRCFSCLIPSRRDACRCVSVCGASYMTAVTRRTPFFTELKQIAVLF